MIDIFKVLFESFLTEGPVRIIQYLVYHGGLRSGLYRYLTPTDRRYHYIPSTAKKPLLDLPSQQRLIRVMGDSYPNRVQNVRDLISSSANNNDENQPLDTPTPIDHNFHWSRTRDDQPANDLRIIWEPARLSWIFTAGSVYHITRDPAFLASFWKNLEEFACENPRNCGLNWYSAQEVALRIISLSFGHLIFSKDSSDQRSAWLMALIADHAERIPPTLSYARAQNNNHLLSEAAGLFTAGIILDDHPSASKWKKMGWKIFHQAICSQIYPDGLYVQQSMNYHRLMLHLSLWVYAISRKTGQPFPEQSMKLLAAATVWLLGQIDPISGGAPNLGHNDGSNILPFPPTSGTDYRPVAQASARAFLNRSFFPPGPWDELSLWLGLTAPLTENRSPFFVHAPCPRLGNPELWTLIKASNIRTRPAHADQLHMEIWWQGQNIARDPGTFRYTAEPPWDNGLASTFVHNTIEMNSRDQMKRIGRFRWLNWSKGDLVYRPDDQTIIAEHDGYLPQNVRHVRKTSFLEPNEIRVLDTLIPVRPKASLSFSALNWMLPDWEWSFENGSLTLNGPVGMVHIHVSSPHQEGIFQLVRAGCSLMGPAADPRSGWFSQNYNAKEPSLSFRFLLTAALPHEICTHWVFV